MIGNIISAIFGFSGIRPFNIGLALNSSPNISVYNFLNGFGAKYSDPATLPPSTSTGITFKPQGDVIAVANAASPFIVAYPWSPGFGGQSAGQLIQSLMAGYAGVPMATQPTGATAPGMGTMSQPEGSLPTAPAGDLWAGLPKKTRRRLKKIGVDSGTYDPETDYNI